MRIVSDGRATATTMSAEYSPLATPPMTPMPLRIPRQRFLALLHLLQTLRVPCIKHRQQDRREMRPDSPCHETLADRVARTAPYLYIRSLSG
jgi:hypothetical protein